MVDAGASPLDGSGQEGSGLGPDRLLTIGQLVRELQSDFPDLSVSKVRYLEARGLLSPARTKGRYRKYNKADVRSLRGILSMQRDEYLPLEVIRQRVSRADRSALGRTAATSAGAPRFMLKLMREEPAYTLGELCDAVGVDEEFALGLVEFRLLERSGDSGAVFTESDLDTARICHRLARFDVEPRHLRILSSAAEREASLIEQVATPSLRSAHADRKEYGVEVLEELGSLFAQLMQLLLRRELQRVL